MPKNKILIKKKTNCVLNLGFCFEIEKFWEIYSKHNIKLNTQPSHVDNPNKTHIYNKNRFKPESQHPRLNQKLFNTLLYPCSNSVTDPSQIHLYLRCSPSHALPWTSSILFDLKSNLFKVCYKPWIRIANLTSNFKKVCLVQIMP